ELNKAVADVSPEALELLKKYSWPGNIRQMQSVLRQAILQATGPLLLPDFLPAEIRQPSAPAASADGAVERAVGESTESVEAYLEAQLKTGTNSLYTDCVTHLERIML